MTVLGCQGLLDGLAVASLALSLASLPLSSPDWSPLSSPPNDLLNVLWNADTPRVGALRFPVIVIESSVPAPSLLKNGSTAFRKNDFLPVTVSDSFACSRRCPLKSSVPSPTS